MSTTSVKCVFCQDALFGDMAKNPPAVSTCGHVFHRECLFAAAKKVSTCPMCKRRLIPRHSGPIFLGADDFTAKFESNPNNRSPARVSENSDICAQMHAPPFLDDGVQVNAVLFLDDDAHVHAPACSHNGAQRNTQADGEVKPHHEQKKVDWSDMAGNAVEVGEKNVAVAECPDMAEKAVDAGEKYVAVADCTDMAEKAVDAGEKYVAVADCPDMAEKAVDAGEKYVAVADCPDMAEKAVDANENDVAVADEPINDDSQAIALQRTIPPTNAEGLEKVLAVHLKACLHVPNNPDPLPSEAGPIHAVRRYKYDRNVQLGPRPQLQVERVSRTSNRNVMPFKHFNYGLVKCCVCGKKFFCEAMSTEHYDGQVACSIKCFKRA